MYAYVCVCVLDASKILAEQDLLIKVSWWPFSPNHTWEQNDDSSRKIPFTPNRNRTVTRPDLHLESFTLRSLEEQTNTGRSAFMLAMLVLLKSFLPPSP